MIFFSAFLMEVVLLSTLAHPVKKSRASTVCPVAGRLSYSLENRKLPSRICPENGCTCLSKGQSYYSFCAFAAWNLEKSSETCFQFTATRTPHEINCYHH